MPLVEALAVGLATTIAKSILKSWLRDASIAEDASIGIVDTLKSLVPDQLAQRRGSRQFEEIADMVAKDLAPVFDRSGIDERRQVDIATSAQTTMEHAGIAAELIVQQNLDPATLTQHILNSRPEAIESYSPGEVWLYQRVIARSASYVVDIASDLPRFTERSIAEILSRQRYLMDIAERVLDEFRTVRTQEQREPDDSVARFEMDYREAVIRNLDKIEWFGVDVGAHVRRQRVTVAYVSLSVQDDSGVMSPSNSGDLDVGEDDDFVGPVEDVLSRSKRLLIRGDAGSGKTTLLRWIAVRSAGATFREQLETLNGTVPFHIPLRQFVDTELPQPEEFPGVVAPSIAAEMPAGWVHDHLRTGDAIVLVDGIDELPETQRPELRTWLNELTGTFPDTKFVVTSRPGAISGDWRDDDDWDEAEVQPMELEQVYGFIERWHAAVRDALDSPESIAQLDQYESNLKVQVKTNRSIRLLSTNPLLCGVICALHHGRNREVPSDRVELYESCCYMLLERRDRERQLLVGSQDYPLLNCRQKRALLEDLAYWMMRNNKSMATIERVDDRFLKKLQNMALDQTKATPSSRYENLSPLIESNVTSLRFWHCVGLDLTPLLKMDHLRSISTFGLGGQFSRIPTEIQPLIRPTRVS